MEKASLWKRSGAFLLEHACQANRRHPGLVPGSTSLRAMPPELTGHRSPHDGSRRKAGMTVKAEWRLTTHCGRCSKRQNDGMADIIYLARGEQMPEAGDDEPWLLVEASDDGRFFGTGAALKPSGETVIYTSLAESDGSLDSAIQAACRWAEKYNVPRIWVQSNPEGW